MITYHKIVFDSIENYPLKEKVHLIVTSPPYPMIEMWDSLFNFIPYKEEEWGPGIKARLSAEPSIAHKGMVKYITNILSIACKLLVEGGMVCINIGDATRSLKIHKGKWVKEFYLFCNRSLLTQTMLDLGFTQLPGIVWRKPNNSPNKFMGSGTLPVKAYVTLEHEHILIFRKGVRQFSKKEERIRKRSAFFWEERNKWFSDLWELVGAPQSKNGNRTAAYPLEIPYRLINMFSIQGDTVIDPFLGTGTTLKAAAISGRNCIGFEINKKLNPIIANSIIELKELGISHALNRLEYHKSFIQQSTAKYRHPFYGKVKTKPETYMRIPQIKNMLLSKNSKIYTLKCNHKFLGAYE